MISLNMLDADRESLLYNHKSPDIFYQIGLSPSDIGIKSDTLRFRNWYYSKSRPPFKSTLTTVLY